ncbi:MAG TPA: hypothetical protein VI704_03875 [Bacteroidota bacterium]|nr:hypothetical protein [Bacteroidota bacterium]
MSRSQQYIASLLEHLPKASLPDDGQQTFDRIRDKIGTAADVMEELKALYKVNNLSDVALSLIWIAEKVENDPSRLDPTNDEEALVFSTFQSALGGVASDQPQMTTLEPGPTLDFPSAPAEPSPPEDLAADNPFDSVPTEVAPESPAEPSAPEELAAANPFDSVPTEVVPESPAEPSPPEEVATSFEGFGAPPSTEESVPSDFGTPAQEATPREPSILESTPFAEGLPGHEQTAAPEPPTASQPEEPVSVGGGGGDEVQHAALFEKFIEALQSGADDRMALYDQLVQLCNSVVSGSGPQEYKDYSQLLIDLLKSLNDNQMLDDIRAMNMLSTGFDPFSQWAKADPAGREGVLRQGIEALRGFKALFE